MTFSDNTYIGTSFTITRDNIGSIISQLLAWRGTFFIPIMLILLIFPWVEQIYKFDLMKARLES
jgi:predicted MFS family arabinose efflux permease